MNVKLMRAIDQLAADAVTDGTMPAGNAIEGVRAVSFSDHGRLAAMLFVVNGEADLAGTSETVLYDVFLQLNGDEWAAQSGGVLGTDGILEEIATRAPGLHEITRTSIGPVRHIWAVATPQTSSIRFFPQNDPDREPGYDGYVILATTPEDPITYASAVDASGRQLPAAPILL